eukprot:scaffold102874_cov60-Phaeocystis_antarctica.AAC.2
MVGVSMLNSCGHASKLRTRREHGEGKVRARLRGRQRGLRCRPREEERRWCGGAPEGVKLYVPHRSREQVGALLQQVVGHARVVRLRPVLERTDAAPVAEVVGVVEERHRVTRRPHHAEDGDQAAPEEAEEEETENVRAPTVAERLGPRPVRFGTAAAHHSPNVSALDLPPCCGGAQPNCSKLLPRQRVGGKAIVEGSSRKVPAARYVFADPQTPNSQPKFERVVVVHP